MSVVTWLTGSSTPAEISFTFSNPIVTVNTLSAPGGGFYPDLIEKDESLVLVHRLAHCASPGLG
jgi:hypothetical protein